MIDVTSFLHSYYGTILSRRASVDTWVIKRFPGDFPMYSNDAVCALYVADLHMVLQQTQSIMGHPIVDHRPDGSCFVLLPRSFLLNARELGRFPVCKCP